MVGWLELTLKSRRRFTLWFRNEITSTLDFPLLDLPVYRLNPKLITDNGHGKVSGSVLVRSCYAPSELTCRFTYVVWGGILTFSERRKRRPTISPRIGEFRTKSRCPSCQFRNRWLSCYQPYIVSWRCINAFLNVLTGGLVIPSDPREIRRD